MILSEKMTITQFQTKFRKKFPGLKIEFYSKKHGVNAGSLKENQLNESLLLKDITGKKLGEIEFTPAMTVAQLEQKMEKQFGLHVQVFRRSNTLWLQTSSTDDWTLEKQNTKGLHSMVS
ncbi:MAG: hypothetical protein HKN67_13065 [Saprospiraceae bacterium]|nr:hypothetical protein [Bacteroidia bacterium]MBT8230576.1 hypothetical protein [Bacteroidia bacterium]NNF22867.1 hypothetical protein [Saprospiraceae bacterium]NNK90056.1 hypothetical protein [Saprospiraceae bacterium]